MSNEVSVFLGNLVHMKPPPISLELGKVCVTEDVDVLGQDEHLWLVS